MVLATNMLPEDSKIGYPHSLAELISQTCAKYGDKPAFSNNNETITFKEIDTYSKKLAAWLQVNTDLQQGDRVAIQLPNCIAYPIAAYAILRGGFVIVNTNPMYTETEM